MAIEAINNKGVFDTVKVHQTQQENQVDNNVISKDAKIRLEKFRSYLNEGDNLETKAIREENKISKSQLQENIDKFNEQARFNKTKCEFSYHEDINRVAIKVIDEDTEEIIREIPPEETLNMIKRIREMMGISIDKKV